MRAWLLLASFAAVSSTASAQSQDSSRPGLGYVASGTEAENRSRLDRGGRYECLIRKSDGKRECHTRAEWRAIAMRIDNAGRAKP